MKHVSISWRGLLLLALLTTGSFAALAQNVGIGTTQPTQKLDVNGSLRVRGLNGADTRLPVVLPDGTLGVNAPVYGTTAATPAFPTAAAGSVGTGSQPYSVAVSGTAAYVVNYGSNTLQVFDVSNPASPVLRGSVGTGSQPYSVAVSGTAAYVVNYGSNTLQVFDVSNPASPVLRGSVGTDFGPHKVAVSGTTAYILCKNPSFYSGNLQVFDVSNPANPTYTTRYNLGTSPRDMAVSGNNCYIVDAVDNNMQVFDVSNPANPTFLNSVGTGSYSYSVAVSGTAAYVVNYGSNTLKVFDVSNPANPTFLNSVGTGSQPYSVAVSGTVAYVVNYSSNTLQVFDVSNPASPVLRGSVGTGSSPFAVAGSNNKAYVVNYGSNTLQIFLIPGPPRTVGVNSDGSFASLAPPTLSVSGQSLSITGGNTVTLPPTAAAGPGLSSTLSGGITTVKLGGSALTAATDVPLAGNNLTFSGSTGNVGIGTTTPAQKLDVTGNTNVTGNSYVSGSVGIGTTAPNASAVLDVTSTTKGLLPPRMTLAQRDVLSPGPTAAGLLVYNTTIGKLNVWNGTTWSESLTTSEQPFQNPAQTFTYVGGVQTYTVPAGVTRLNVVANGAQGGSGNGGATPQGRGARVQATLAVTPGQVLQVVVGGVGGEGAGGAYGGYNGGGLGGGNSTGTGAGGGGGASDVRTSGGALADRILVAGGGGGGGPDYFVVGGSPNAGGNGGDPNGGNAAHTFNVYGQGGTQAAGGQPNGSLGNGGGTPQGSGGSYVDAGGGGGGYYGGGCGCSPNAVGYRDSGGGGGSSWVTSTGSTGVVMTAGANYGYGSVTITPAPVYAAPTLDGSNISGTWSVSGADVYRASGNVGIGTSTPAQKLDVVGNANISGNMGIGTNAPLTSLSITPSAVAAKITLYDGGATANHYGFGITASQLNYHVFSTGDRHVFYAGGKNGDGTELMRIQGNGNVGIGTTNPIAKLHVNGAATATDVAGSFSYFNPGTGLTATTNPGGATRALAAYFEGGQFWVNNAIVAGTMNVSSDRRIKHIVGLSDRAADLALLNQLRVTDYTYIDKLANTDKVVKKVIAQEIQALMPVAVNTSTQAIPNVYEKAARVSFAQGRVSVTTAKPHELPAAGGKMRLYTPTNVDVTADATVVDAHTFSFASAQAYDAGLFVYGKFVDDFLSVDYDALAMLNVSATQELARKVAALEKQNAALQARTAQADADHADLQTLKEQLARLLGEPAPASAQARK